MNKVHEIISATTNSFVSFCSDLLTKCVASGAYIMSGFFFGTDNFIGLRAVVALIIFDFVTAIFAAKKAGEEIKSAKVLRSAVKVVIYYLMIASAHLGELAIPFIDSFVDETVIAFLAVTEIISIFENVGKAGFVIPQKLLNKLKKYRDDK